jgi:hypothetical protein
METKVIVMFAVLHGSAILRCAGLMIMLARSTPDVGSGERDDPGGGGEGPPLSPCPGPSGGGFLLPDSLVARVRLRLREPVRPGALWPSRPRRAHPDIDARPSPEKRPLHLSGGGAR